MTIISIEGGNGVGKTTLAEGVTEQLQALGYNAKYAKLPGHSEIPGCVAIRKILQNGESLSPRAKYNLFMKDMQLFYEWVNPETIWVLDRSFISTIVYQTLDGITGVTEDCQKAGFFVDYAILLTCNPAVAVNRLNCRKSKTLANYKDREVDFYDQVQESYKHFIQLLPSFTVIDTTDISVDSVLSRAIQTVLRKIES